MITAQNIKTAAEEFFEEVRNYRRHMHAHPELSYEEHDTVRYVASILDQWEIPYEHCTPTGLVAYLKGANPTKKVIALRADLDALPIHEANNTTYKSINDGKMHACGHDVHTSALLGAIRILKQYQDQWEGTIKLIFQPGEEQIPGGAYLMMQDGVLKNPEPMVIFGQHVMPELESGTIGLKPGKFMASSDEIAIAVNGKGGHAAMPHKTVDPILIASHLVVALQQTVSRHSDPNIPTVLSFGSINGGEINNVIPDQVELLGTFRTFDENWRAEAHQKIKKLAEELVSSMGASCEINIKEGYPCLINDETTTKHAQEWAIEFLGADCVHDLNFRPTAEDFAYYSQAIPGCFYRLGVANPSKGINSSLHTSTFDVDEEALKTGMGLMAFLALKTLNQ